MAQLVSQALRFISTAIRSGYYKQLFSSKETIASLVQGVVVPNVGLRGMCRLRSLPFYLHMCSTEHEIEQFEDDPLEYIRLDLSLPSQSGGLGLSHDVLTRRQAAADVLRALVSSGLEAETTEVAGAWINQGLQEYNNNKGKEDSWKAKDTAVYLLTAVATRGSTTQVCEHCLQFKCLDNSPDFTIAWCHVNQHLGRRRPVLLRTCLPGFASSSWYRAPSSAG